jgi:hypothetical protein
MALKLGVLYIKQGGLCHIVALPFTFKSILRQREEL